MVGKILEIRFSGNLGYMRFHDLRHTFATMAISNGVDEKPVQYAAPLQRRVHSEHLHAHHQRYAERCNEKAGDFIHGSI